MLRRVQYEWNFLTHIKLFAVGERWLSFFAPPASLSVCPQQARLVRRENFPRASLLSFIQLC